MLNALYTLIIYPLTLIVELAYRVAEAVFNNPGAILITVSAVITLLCLPLYAVAEWWQEVEREKLKSMEKGIRRIKETFHGDEGYMILSTFYKQQHYTPLMQLRQSFGVLIQIPFFLAAYQYLSHNTELLGRQFLFIKDLGRPDALFSIAGWGVNILPIAMTAINLISGAIYSKGHPLREKIQILVMALVFLVVLYNSPAALVIYWTTNNLFSLVKNIFYKLRHPLKVFWICGVALFGAITIYLLVTGFERVAVFVFATIIICLLPLIIKGCKKIFTRPVELLSKDRTEKNKSCALFFVSAAAIALLCGVVIPSFLMTSSPGEYCYLGDGHDNPLYYLWISGLQAFGLFVLWPGCVYFLFGRDVKAILAMIFFLAVLFGVTNNFFFPGDYGNVLPEIEFTEHKTFWPSIKLFILNTLVLILLFGGVYFLFFKGLHKIINIIATVTLICIALTSAVNIIKVGQFYKSFDKPAPQLSSTDECIHLSKTQKNVIVIMLDGVTGYMTPKVFLNRPELLKDFDGFVFYPNCTSFGPWTIQGAPPLYGGYEYTPYEMNKRRDKAMVDKHNEALTLQARVFSKAGYNCTVLDPPYPNYDAPPVFQEFEDIPNTTCRQLVGRYNDVYCAENNLTLINFRTIMIKRNFLLFGVFKTVPMIARPFVVYHDFWRPAKATSGRDLKRFLDNYSILNYLPRITNTSSDKPGFVIMDNEIKHDGVYLQLPDFTPNKDIDNSAYIKENKWYSNAEFHVTSAAYIKLAQYFRYLKDNDVYDNTRIIITADHGSTTRIKDLFDDSPAPYMLENMNPVFLIKDFDSHGEITKNEDFMTNADTPAIAFCGVIDNPTNPKTGNEIKPLVTAEKNKKAIISFSKANGVLATVNNGFNIKEGDWWTVHDKVFSSSNWTRLKK